VSSEHKPEHEVQGLVLQVLAGGVPPEYQQPHGELLEVNKTILSVINSKIENVICGDCLKAINISKCSSILDKGWTVGRIKLK